MNGREASGICVKSGHSFQLKRCARSVSRVSLMPYTVTGADVAEALTKSLGRDIDKRTVEIDEHIRSLGADTVSSGGVAYFAQGLQIPAGLGIIITAYVLRFIIRRLPIIG